MYLSEEEVTFPVVMKTDKGDFVEGEVIAPVCASNCKLPSVICHTYWTGTVYVLG